ncbi:MAG: DUF177 domain-containing protein [Bacilli bacterium]|nr:DUF177 domain-containing protein [Bacilli bacterium]
MKIDLTELLNFETEEIFFEEVVSFSESYLENSEIKEIEPVTVKGKCHLEENNIILTGTLSGRMKLEDVISLENIQYPFSFEFEEVLEEIPENNEKGLDITDVLWQNIVLEVPLKRTEVTDFSKYQGDGWKLVTEEEAKNTNNPFNELANMWGEE